MISLQFDTQQMQKQLAPLLAFPQEAEKAVYQSVKKSMMFIRKEIGTELRALSMLQSRKVTSAIGNVRITNSGSALEGVVRVESTPIHLSDYQMSPRRVTAMRGKRSSRWRTLRWRIERGEAFRDNKGQDGYSMAFAGHGKNSGKLIIFRRDKQNKLHAQWGPRVQYFMAFERVQDSLTKKAHARFDKLLAHEVEYRLSKLGAR